MAAILSYIERESVIHKLTGTTKLIFFIFWSIAAMVTYDTRVLIVMFFTGCLLFYVSRLKWTEIRFALIFMFVLMAINMVGIFLFSPEQGVEIYQTRHVLIHLFWRYTVTIEQLFYMFNFMMKYMAVIPVALLFILATNPSEFAASLAGIGVNYRIAYAVAIALRYIPDVQKDFREISQAQQARGIDLSKKDSFMDRMKNSSAILFPLVLASLHRIEVISNAMELRGFGKMKKRTWIVGRKLSARDYIALVMAVMTVVFSMVVTFYDGSRFYNPFL
ncbi:MAG: energy-coupling factor transporter transmembrane component T [Lachnospiraceae bacterium]|nr:energy-coupling factor transporter transmembrane component T [Lachnospiraceae bacterium]MDD3661328.1 energy-coupling factor transporter transmembrane component T [Lachnospiraceae bacterium]